MKCIFNMTKGIVKPLVKIAKKHAKRLGLEYVYVRFIVDYDGTMPSHCWSQNSIVINVDEFTYGTGDAEYLDMQKAERAIAHEMRHAWQIASGILSVTDDYFIWDGNKYERPRKLCVMLDFDSGVDSAYEEYLNRPWEIDARQYEEKE